MSELHRYDGATWTVVVNPAAGRGRARRELPAICDAILTGAPGTNLRVFQTTDYAEARLRCIAAVEQARPAVPGHARDSLVVVGGDGMVHLGLNACAGTDVPLGCIPAGTGNDLARGLGLPSSPVAAARVVAQGRTRRMDLARVTGAMADGAQQRWVGSVVCTGFDARVTMKANDMSFPRGGLRYAAAALSVLRDFEPLHYRLRIDGRPRSLQAMFIAVGTSGYFGGGMKVLPQYQLDDGLLDVTVIHPVSRATLLRLLPTMYSGAFVRDPAVELLRARVVEIDGEGLYGTADGERMGPVPLRIESDPGALTVFVGAGVAAGAR